MDTTVNVTVAGAAGRMGTRLVSLIHDSPSLNLVGALESPDHRALGRDAGELAGCGTTGVTLTADLESACASSHVIVDFTTPSATLVHLRHAVSRRQPMVIGTTGFSPEESRLLQEEASRIPCVWSPNMSVGVTVLLQLLGKVAQVLGDDYDVEIVEAHHQKKKDAPSGTALKLAEVVASAKGWHLPEVAVYARHGFIGERAKRTIGIQTIRAGDIVGDHTVLFGGLGERIEIIHRAHNRDPFARGALRAAQWIVRQPPGLYSMAHVLGLVAT
ncbi:MAG: 4-hydroxy-tetrahydrodipicolinate reductase [Nitrospirae bacterium]|nr:MAG: 4-hydroxy-tetrahydrodipicolinate reductase [Nitrospirota bacterium]